MELLLGVRLKEMTAYDFSGKSLENQSKKDVWRGIDLSILSYFFFFDMTITTMISTRTPPIPAITKIIKGSPSAGDVGDVVGPVDVVVVVVVVVVVSALTVTMTVSELMLPASSCTTQV